MKSFRHRYRRNEVLTSLAQNQGGLLVLLVWLFISPLASNLIDNISSPDLIKIENDYTPDKKLLWRGGYFYAGNSATLNQLLEPTRTLVAFFVIVFLLNGLIRKNFGHFDTTEVWMAVFSLILVVSVLLKSKVVGYSTRVASDAFIVPFLAYFIARRLITTEDRYRRLVKTVAYMGVYLIVISLIERGTQEGLFYRLSGPFQTSTTLYMVMMVAFFIVLAEHFYTPSVGGDKIPLPRSARRLVVYLTPIVILLIWSRGAWVGFLMGLCVFLVLGQRLMKPSQRSGLVGIGLMFVAMISFGVQELAQSLDERVGESLTVYGRIATWMVAIKSGLTSPIFGIGLNNIREVLATNTVEFQGVANFPRIHNSFLQILAEQGVVGLVVYLSIMVLIVRLGFRIRQASLHARDRWRGISLIAIMIAYLAPAMFASTAHLHVTLAHVFVYAFCGALAGRYGRRRRTSEFYAFRGKQQLMIRPMPAAVRYSQQ